MSASPPAGPAATPLLNLMGVAKSFGPRRVLQDVELTVRRGEAVAVLGPNGAGKSTLLRIAAGVSPATSGTIQLHSAPEAGGPIDLRKSPDAGRTRVGTLLQDAPTFGDLSAREHLRLAAVLRGVPDPAQAAQSLLDAAGLAKAADRLDLSRGERQRLGLALAFSGNPPLLVLDEPFTALDASGRAWLEAELAARRAAGAAILMSLHDEADARRLADRRVRLAGGRLEAAP